MVECGSMNQLPSFSNITVWGIIIFIIMFVVGANSVFGVIHALDFKDSLLSILILIGSGFGVAGLIFAILAIVQSNLAHMKVAALCFLISCLVNVVLIVFSIIRDGFFFGTILQIIFNVFLCYLFYVQSNGSS